ncbi:hypothetical protein PQX77_014553 [Marasmius sp. AFHP31]|nr:hypothetical protein PQX77_014553 [Marasmius sp. AFHP31]
MDSQERWRQLEYWMKWKGYLEKENTWEPAQKLKNTPRIVKWFHKKFPGAAEPAYQEGA